MHPQICITALVLFKVECHVSWTNDETKQIILENINRSPLYAGKIEFAERAYSHEELCAFAQAAGLTLAGYYEEMTRTPPHADTERAIYVMKKEGALN